MKTFQINHPFIKLAYFVFAFCFISYSQTSELTSAENSTLSKYLQIGFINETALYYHYPINTSLSIKSGMSIVWNYRDETDGDGYRNYDQSYYPYTQKLSRESNGVDNNYNISLSSILFYQISDYEYARVYFGVGLSIMDTYLKTSGGYKEYTDTTSYSNSNDMISKTIGVGPATSLMITTHIYERVSIVSEYSFIANYNWNTLESNYFSYSKDHYSNSPSFSRSNTHVESNGWGLKFSNLKVGLLIELK